MNRVLEEIYRIGIVPVIALHDVKDAVPLAKALVEGGLSELKKKLIEKRLSSISRTGKLKAKTADQTGGGKPKCYKCKGLGTVQVFRLEPCAECNGKGVIKTGSRSGSDCAACGRRGRVSVERDVECPVCHGKGKL